MANNKKNNKNGGSVKAANNKAANNKAANGNSAKTSAKNGGNKKPQKTMEDYRNATKKREKRARVVALVLVAVMVIFAVISSVYFLF